MVVLTIFGVLDLIDTQWNSKQNKGVKNLLNVINVFSKFARSVLIRDKTGTTVKNASKKIIQTSKQKPNRLWVNQGTEFYSRVLEMVE